MTAAGFRDGAIVLPLDAIDAAARMQALGVVASVDGEPVGEGHSDDVRADGEVVIALRPFARSRFPCKIRFNDAVSGARIAAPLVVPDAATLKAALAAAPARADHVPAAPDQAPAPPPAASDDLSERVARLEAALADAVTAAASREALLLDRLDLFHGLLHARIDRAFGTVAPAPDADAAPPPADRILSPHDIEGVGFYRVEGSEAKPWRWFSPRTTLILRDVPAGVRGLRLDFGSLPDAADPDGIRVAVNALPVPVEVRREGEKAASLLLDLSAVPWAGGIAGTAALIVTLQLAYRAPSTPDDQRVLSATFKGGVLSA